MRWYQCRWQVRSLARWRALARAPRTAWGWSSGRRSKLGMILQVWCNSILGYQTAAMSNHKVQTITSNWSQTTLAKWRCSCCPWGSCRASSSPPPSAPSGPWRRRGCCASGDQIRFTAGLKSILNELFHSGEISYFLSLPQFPSTCVVYVRFFVCLSWGVATDLYSAFWAGSKPWI